MVCNQYLHNVFSEIGYIDCVFCDKVIQKYETSKYGPCCDSEHIILDGGHYLCKSCCQVTRFKFYDEYIDYRQNIHRIYKKSVYDRKYHLNYTIDNLCFNSGVYVKNSVLVKVHKIFREINNYTASN